MKACSISVVFFYRNICSARGGHALQAATSSSLKYASPSKIIQKLALKTVGGSGDPVLDLCGF